MRPDHSKAGFENRIRLNHRKQPDRQSAEGRLGKQGSSESTNKPRRCLFNVACLAFVEHMPLRWHSETINSTLLDCAVSRCTLEKALLVISNLT
jgi:hypothetical protein